MNNTQPNIVEELVRLKIADNIFHASGMLNVLDCSYLPDDAARIARCELYKAWKQAGETKAIARKHAIAGDPAPAMMELKTGAYFTPEGLIEGTKESTAGRLQNPPYGLETL